jgi:hypothetical protein
MTIFTRRYNSMTISLARVSSAISKAFAVDGAGNSNSPHQSRKSTCPPEASWVESEGTGFSISGRHPAGASA